MELTPDQWATKLNIASGVVGRAVTPVVAETAEKIADTQRSLVRKKSGDTHDQIEVRGFGGGPVTGPEADVGVFGDRAFIARFLENGTVRTRPYPFIKPSADAHVPRFLTEVSKASADLLKDRR